MVLLGQVVDSSVTCMLFKMPKVGQLEPQNVNDEQTEDIVYKSCKVCNPEDTLNIFMACPLHLLKTSEKKIRVKICGNENIAITNTLYVTVILFPVQHCFLDLAMGIVDVEGVEKINNSYELKDLTYLNYDDSIYDNGGIVNKSCDLLYANNDMVNNLPSKILNMNYEIGQQEGDKILHPIPCPGGFISVYTDAKEGLSGSVVVYKNSIVGLITLSSGNSQSNCLATDMYYIMPHFIQCTSAIHKFTMNDKTKLNELTKYSTMNKSIELEQALTPVVNYLGASYIFNQLSKNNSIKYITLKTIHNYIHNNSLKFESEKGSNSSEIKTILNSNKDFMDYFFSNEEKSEVIITNINYYDKIFKDRIDINFEENTIFANLLDWSFRGDPTKEVIFTIQQKIRNNNNTVTFYEDVARKFNLQPVEVSDTFDSKQYPRYNTQIPSMFFNKINSQNVITSNFSITDAQTGLPKKLTFLSNSDLIDVVEKVVDLLQRLL
jgi:hypothetical protein